MIKHVCPISDVRPRHTPSSDCANLVIIPAPNTFLAEGLNKQLVSTCTEANWQCARLRAFSLQAYQVSAGFAPSVTCKTNLQILQCLSSSFRTPNAFCALASVHWLLCSPWPLRKTNLQCSRLGSVPNEQRFFCCIRAYTQAPCLHNCFISGRQPTRLYKEFPRIHNAGHSKKRCSNALLSARF